MTRIYRGWLAEHDWGEADDILFMTGVSDPLAKAIRDDMRAHGNFLTVRYFISDTELSGEELEENLVRQIVGAGDAKFRSHYSDITGYLWTDEELNVGGHNLLDELSSKLGKFCHLEITYSQAPVSEQEEQR